MRRRLNVCDPPGVTEAHASKQETLLRRIADPSTTAVLTMELQEGVVGKAEEAVDKVKDAVHRK